MGNKGAVYIAYELSRSSVYSKSTVYVSLSIKQAVVGISMDYINKSVLILNVMNTH